MAYGKIYKRYNPRRRRYFVPPLQSLAYGAALRAGYRNIPYYYPPRSRTASGYGGTRKRTRTANRQSRTLTLTRRKRRYNKNPTNEGAESKSWYVKKAKLYKKARYQKYVGAPSYFVGHLGERSETLLGGRMKHYSFEMLVGTDLKTIHDQAMQQYQDTAAETLLGGAYGSQKVLMLSSTYSFEIKNIQNIPIHMELRIVRAKSNGKDTHSVGEGMEPLTQWNVGTAKLDDPTAPASGDEPYFIIGSRPQMSHMFNKYWKQVKYKKITLGPGATHYHFCKLHWNRFITEESGDLDTLEDLYYQRGWSHCLLLSHWGTPVHDTEATPNITTGCSTVDIVVGAKHKYTQVVGCSTRYFQGSLLTKVAEGNQQTTGIGDPDPNMVVDD